jgi:hypothetical protein
MKPSRLKIVLLLMLSMWLVPLCFAQVGLQLPERNKNPILIGRCVSNCLHDDLSQEYAFALANAARYAKIAIRLCSNERFEIAVAKASSNLMSLADELKSEHHVNTDDISLLLSNSCLPKTTGRTATEFWIIPPTASLPNYNINVNLKNVSINVIREGNSRSSTEEFIEQLRQKPDSYGVIIGSYFLHPSSIIKRRVQEAVKQTKSYPNLKGRFSIDFVPYGVIYTGYVEPTKPDFLIVQIFKNSSVINMR